MSVARFLGCLWLAVFSTSALAQTALLNPIFQDHAVLQRDRAIAVWGRADANTSVAVSLAGNSVTASADGAGNWKANLPALPAGGPYVLQAESNGRVQRIADVLVGDVWLCSGQSNMMLQVRYTLDAYSEISGTASDSIRMATIPTHIESQPSSTLAQAATWQPASAATVGDFSAACFYFARALQKSVHVPMGLVNASWGGSKIRTWMSEPALRASGYFGTGLDILDLYAKDPLLAVGPFGAVWEDWWRHGMPSASGQEPWSPALDVRTWPQAPALGYWDDWGVPVLVNRTGMVWYRTSVDLTAAQAAQPASISLGQVDEIAAAWVNGIFVGDGSTTPQTYSLAPGTLHAGSNIVAVNILNTYKKGGLVGPSSAQGLHFADGTTVPLSEPWRYSLVPQNLGEPPRAPWEPLGGLTMAYNGMIAPLGSYGLRGALWYQGESDTGETEKYKALMLGLMQDWRRQFGHDLPFLIVQLPNYGLPPMTPVDSGWARLRDAERAAVEADGNASLVVTTDLGEDYDVHPPNKQEVGRRLALAARRSVYGENIVASGPVAQVAERERGRVAVRFANVAGRLVAYSSDSPIGFELCGVAQASCRFAPAEIAKDRVYLTVPAKFAPTHVRYCWADGPVCTLFDDGRLPAAPFDLTITNQSAGKKTAHRKSAKR